jgi:hypothetical protein
VVTPDFTKKIKQSNIEDVEEDDIGDENEGYLLKLKEEAAICAEKDTPFAERVNNQ